MLESTLDLNDALFRQHINMVRFLCEILSLPNKCGDQLLGKAHGQTGQMELLILHSTLGSQGMFLRIRRVADIGLSG